MTIWWAGGVLRCEYHMNVCMYVCVYVCMHVGTVYPRTRSNSETHRMMLPVHADAAAKYTANTTHAYVTSTLAVQPLLSYLCSSPDKVASFTKRKPVRLCLALVRL